MDAETLCKKLGIQQADLSGLLDQGIPHEKRGEALEFEERSVAKWIRERASKQAPAPEYGPIARNLPELRRMLQERGKTVSERTIHRWKRQFDDFPGTPSTRGLANGYYPLLEIEAWIQRNITEIDDGSGDFGDTPKSRFAEAKTQLAELAVQKELGNLVSRAEALRALHRQQGLILAMMEGLPERAASLVPVEHQEKIRSELDRWLGQLRESVADQMKQEEVAKESEHANN